MTVIKTEPQPEEDVRSELSLAGIETRQSSTGWRAVARGYAKDKAALVSAIILGIIVLVTVLAPVVSPDSPYATTPSLRLAYIGTPGHLLGMDFQGSDMLSRLIWGGRVTLPDSVLPVVFALVISLFLGITAGYLGGLIDGVIMRVMDVLLALPSIVLAIALASALGPGSRSVVVAATLAIIAPLTRVAYTATRDQSYSEYVTAAKAMGASFRHIMLRHLLPNVLAPVLVYGTTILGLLVIFTASLSFLGLGVSPPTPEWGLMVDEGRSVLSISPHVSIEPGILIAIVALCFNFIGDGLRYALDPRQRRG